MNFIEEKCKEFDAMEDEFEHMKGYGYMGHGIVKQFIKKSLQEQQAEIVENIHKYIQECRNKGFETQTIVEHLENKYIVANIINPPQQGE